MGDHLKRRRIELGLTQKEVALRCGVSDLTIHNWEKYATTPPVRYLPQIVAILGYDPYPSPQSVGEQLASRRRHLGLSRKRAAKLLGVDEMTLARWERGDVQPSPQQMTRLESLWTKATPSPARDKKE